MNLINIKSKYFLPVALLSVVVIVVSIFSISSKRKDYGIVEVDTPPVEVEESIIDFNWRREGERLVLLMSAKEEVAIGAIDLYIGYRGDITFNNVVSLGGLPEPAFLKISSDNSLVVLNYLIMENEGLKILPGQSIEVVGLDISAEMPNGAEFFIDQETNIVDNNTVKGIPYKSETLIIESSL